MESPNVSNKVIDDQNNITYDVLAYRQLSKEEALQMVRVYLMNTPKRKRPKKNSGVIIFTIIGARD